MLKTFNNLFKRAIAHDGLKKYGANISWLFAEKIFRMAVGFTVGIYVARQLGPAKYGILNYAISFAAIFSIMVSLGLDQIVVRELVKRPRRRDTLLGTTFILRLTGFLLMLGGVAAGLFLSHNDRNTNLIVIIITAGYLFQIFQTIDFYFQANVLSKYVATSQVIAWTIVSGFRAWGAYSGAPLIYFAWLEAANMGLMSLGYLIFYSLNAGSLFKWNFKPHIAKFLLKNSWPLLLAGAAGMIHMRVDQVMIKTMLGATDVGYYAVAVKLVELWYFFPIIICSSLFPAIIRSKGVSEAHYLNRLQKLFTLLFWFAFTLALGTTLIGQQLITWLYGSQYATATTILIIYIWNLIFISLGVARGYWLIAENLQKYSLLFVSVAVIVNILLNYILIKQLGVNGAAWATLISSSIVIYWMPLIIKKTRILCVMFNKAIIPIFLIKEWKGVDK
ncbi:MAG: flippase [Victivallaceae bacterium]|nr:flippase [Victivallaceae bacterium]